MLPLLVSAVILVLLTLGAAAAAVWSEYLVVLRWPHVSPMILERQAGGRYTLLAPMRVPVALARFVGFGAALLGVAVWRRLEDLAPGERTAPVLGR